ncbi:MAG: hypothetical protein HYZ34_03495 [Ignavibacteriae bacterium]|nr:hypothetical protein [Ignavibacteriota bacterium]
MTTSNVSQLKPELFLSQAGILGTNGDLLKALMKEKKNEIELEERKFKEKP